MLNFKKILNKQFFIYKQVDNSESWTSVIKPKNKLLQVDYAEIWHYRDLLIMFIKRDIVTQYKQTVLGPAWYFIQPALTTIMYMVVFGGIAKISTDGLPQPMFYLAGIVCWQYFADCINKNFCNFYNKPEYFREGLFSPSDRSPCNSLIKPWYAWAYSFCCL